MYMDDNVTLKSCREGHNSSPVVSLSSRLKFYDKLHPHTETYTSTIYRLQQGKIKYIVKLLESLENRRGESFRVFIERTHRSSSKLRQNCL